MHALAQSPGYSIAARLRTYIRRFNDEVPIEAPPSEATSEVVERTVGYLDCPQQGHVVRGNVLRVAGWTLFDNQAADTVEVVIDGHPPISLRRGEPRPDLIDPHSPGRTIDRGAGFSDTIGIPSSPAARQIRIRVRATGMNGETWESPSVTCTVPPAETVDALPTAALECNATGGYSTDPSLRPRICVFAHSLSLGGGELYLQELLLRLADADFADFLVISPRDGVLRGALEQAGIQVHLGSPTPDDPDRYVDRRAELGNILQAWRCDAVLANTLGEFMGVDAAITMGLPVAWTIHESFDLDVFEYFLWGHDKPVAIADRLRFALQAADTTIFVSEATLAMFNKMVPDTRGRRISYGIRLDEVSDYELEHDRSNVRWTLGFAERDRVLLCMGLIQERKSQFALVHAFADVLDRFPDAKLAIVGYHPTPYGDAVKDAVAHLGIGHAVHVIDVQSDTYKWFHAADVLVSASDVESLPRSFLEGMAFGLPVLSADVFGVSEIVTDGSTGWLFEARSRSALCDGLVRALSASGEELSTMSKQCREDAIEFDGHGYSIAYRELLCTLAKRTTNGAAGQIGPDSILSRAALPPGQYPVSY